MSVTCSLQCDIFLMSLAQLQNLKAGLPFTYFAGMTRTTAFSANGNNQLDIRNRILAVVVNKYQSNSIMSSFTLEQDVPQNSGSAIGISIGSIAGFCCLLVFCIVFCAVCCATVRRGGGQTTIISSGYNQPVVYGTTSYSTGGNQYSGSIGGTSGGYGTTGGNQYSGSIGGDSGGNQYGGSIGSTGGNQYGGSIGGNSYN